ncbi:restriction endonuclease subunit S [Acinetobacter sp. ANC 4910]|uniref:restriction endonuclease subunit S n=1 Tax=Acinetobacter sp. ANC 4910 TaxID=2529850 RepID=UPI001038E751|nr:restriction endonuclease subunit S [Acinetobacter sp. ANC 4910]TCB37501.1 restriction endonuclease subunit S [Acinetobacter sp. ANC 4910]
MAKYQKYAEYQDSGVEWLGEVPSHWQTPKLFHVTSKIGDGLHSTPVYQEGTGYYFINGNNLVDGKIVIGSTAKEVPNEEFIKHRVFLNESTVLLSINGTIGKVALYEGELVILGKSAAYINCEHKVLALFLLNFLNTLQAKKYYDLEVTGTTIFNLSLNSIRNMKLPLPTILEQTQINSFLDHETAQIDTLIAKQEKLIELLKEKRKAVISHAVTKGLNPNVSMKDSGVEWLGEVPEHWTVSKFGYISQVVRGGSPRPAGDPTLFNGDYSPWVTVAEITKDDELYLTSTETFLTKKGSEQCRVFQTGTLLLSNSGATLGVPKILCINANANDGVVGFEELKIDTEYAYFYLSVLTNDLRERVKQGSGQPNLNTDIVKAISITLPPENEIKEIVAAIKKKINHFSKLMASAEHAIQLMQERRTALISAAVTGKIDVRSWQHPDKKNEVDVELSA